MQAAQCCPGCCLGSSLKRQHIFIFIALQHILHRICTDSMPVYVLLVCEPRSPLRSKASRGMHLFFGGRVCETILPRNSGEMLAAIRFLLVLECQQRCKRYRRSHQLVVRLYATQPAAQHTTARGSSRHANISRQSACAQAGHAGCLGCRLPSRLLLRSFAETTTAYFHCASFSIYLTAPVQTVYVWR